MRDSKRVTDVKNSLLDSVGEGKGGMIWQNSIETCILSYVKQPRFNAWDRVLRDGALGWRWGWDGEGGGKRVQEGGHIYTHGWFMSMDGKNHYNIVK